MAIYLFYGVRKSTLNEEEKENNSECYTSFTNPVVDLQWLIAYFSYVTDI